VTVSRIKSILFVAFFLSGCSGLIYQTVWVRMLTRYLGATTYATATVLVVFMAGLALGSYLSGRLADRVRKHLIVYALLEMAIGILGLLASFFVIEGVGSFYVTVHGWVGDSPATLLAARVIFVLACLLMPTVLMGATLPLMVAYITKLGQHFQASLGWLYAINTYGAVFGVLVSGFVLLGQIGEQGTLLVAGGLNACAALLALLMASKRLTSQPVQESLEVVDTDPIQPYPTFLRRLALTTMFVSGLGALAYEILWTRLLVLLLETSIYAFSVMLGTFLVGIAWGSWDSTRQARLRKTPLASFGFLEILIGFWAALGLLLMPWFHDLWLHASVAYRPVIAIMACVVMVLPIAFFFGLQFPVAVRCCLADREVPGRSTGWAYTVNTLGTIVGALLAGFILLPLMGTTALMLAVAGLNLFLGVVLVMLAPREERGRLPVLALTLTVGFIVLAGLVGDPYLRAMTARVKEAFGPQGVIYSSYEGPAATTVAAGQPDQPLQRALFVNGVGMTMLCNETKVMAHMPYLLAEKPQRMLIICFGMGTTFRSAVKTYPQLQVDAVDIVPEVFNCFGHYHQDAQDVLRRPNAHTHADDGRNYLLTHRELYDVITIDPAPPLHSAGSVNLYTKEFFALCKSRLTPGGVMSMWLPPAPEAEILMIMKSFLDAFPDGSLWGGLEFKGFYLVGGHRSMKQSPARIAELAQQLSRIEDLGEWTQTYRDPARLRQMYLLDAEGMRQLVGNAPAVTDDKPYTEFPLWRQYFDSQGRVEFNAGVLQERMPLLNDSQDQSKTMRENQKQVIK